MIHWSARWVGLPFADRGRGPHAYDCWGLVRAVFAAERGIALPDHGEISAADLMAVARAFASGAAAEPWAVVTTPQEFDVVVMTDGRGGRRVVHVGIMTGPRHLLHVTRATASAIVPLAHLSVAGRIAGFRRLKEN